MTRKKKLAILVLTLCFVILGITAGYFIYSSTLIDPRNQSSLNKHLGLSESSVVTVLAQENYENYCGIYYTDSNENAGITNFGYLRQNKFIKNRYEICGGGSGNAAVNSQTVKRADDETEESPFYFIYGQNPENDICTVFEVDENGYILKKIDEIFVSNEPFILVKKYKLSNTNNDILIFEGRVTEDDIAEMMEQNN